ncbi:hypothetical protein A2635_01930 [Candidatus Peribacteria bacterium RIFCSPHIGHO2_01_FULL_51_9]|nr:MAG: hypothetical protein A2635_01930 [Candidatus Peribacteria bacterium RIFCSPHIGHO2_01_FULL_51_9]
MTTADFTSGVQAMGRLLPQMTEHILTLCVEMTDDDRSVMYAKLEAVYIELVESQEKDLAIVQEGIVQIHACREELKKGTDSQQTYHG